MKQQLMVILSFSRLSANLHVRLSEEHGCTLRSLRRYGTMRHPARLPAKH